MIGCIKILNIFLERKKSKFECYLNTVENKVLKKTLSP